jgi:phosphoenolpyruvate carboxykinase (ATP)
MAIEHTPSILETAFGNLNKVSRNKARMAKHTYVIAETSEGLSHKNMPLKQAQRFIDAQAAYIEGKGRLIEVQGYLGVGVRAVPVEYLYTIEGANIAGMQQVLSFPRDAVESDTEQAFKPKFRVVYTPDFRPEMESKQCILVDLENHITYIMGPDYFGESKKAALRMLCASAFSQGGLVLHAGAKELVLGDTRITVAILGLSGTGKTTTTFSKQGDSVRPIQDDMVTLWPKGELSVTENGCFAKTFGLQESQEPVIYRGTVQPEAWLENAYQNEHGQVDFEKVGISPEEAAVHRQTLIETGADSTRVDQYISREVTLQQITDGGVPKDGWDFIQWTGNGRSIIPLAQVEDAADLHDVPSVKSMGILNRDEGASSITPGLVRFTSPEQAAGYFMLGETTKTSAAGKERGRVRSPFTQPFFPLAHKNQAARFAELLASADHIECWMMNTGYVGGDSDSVKIGQGNKVKIRHSSAMLESLFRNEIVWEIDPDFGYEVVAVDDPANAELLSLVPQDILRPDRAYATIGQWDAYRAEVALRHEERLAYLQTHSVTEKIIASVIPSRS